MRQGKNPGKSKAETRRSVGRKSLKSADSRVRDLEKRLAEAQKREAEALERQTATAEVLRVISSSPTSTQPVFDVIAANAMRVCEALGSGVLRVEGDMLQLAAVSAASPEWMEAARAMYPQPVGGRSIGSRVVLERRVIQVTDIEHHPEAGPGAVKLARAAGYRTVLMVPMLQAGQVVGVIIAARKEPTPFPPRQVELLQTFADQAVIAIENVRLFNETKEALEQQTATSEILRVISRSLTDVQPVFNTIVQSGLRLLGGYSATMMLLLDDERLDLVAYTSISAEADASLAHAFPIPLRRVPAGERAVHERRAHAVEDIESAPDVTDVMRETGRARGWRSNLFVPMIRDEVAVGLISITRREPGPFAADQIAVLEIFAAQAVIAIENVRLFKELEERNRDLTEALEQQTATAEILRVISTSPTDLQPVLDTVVASAARFCGAYDANLLRVDGERLRLAAHHGPIPIAADFSIPLVRGTVAGRSVLERRAVQIVDIQTETEEFPEGRAYALPQGTRTLLSVPLLREGAPVGAIALRRTEVNPFTDKQIALLQTFADQAVIAIENVRLFTELEGKNRELTSALDQQTATSEILSVISRSQTNVQPVFDAIVASAVRLLGAYTGAVTRIAGDQIAIGALTGHDAASDAAVRAVFPLSLQSEVPHAQTIRDRVPLNIADYQTDPRLSEALRASAAIRGYRSLVVVPMLLHDQAIGAIGVTRREPGGFTDDEIALLKTFADQAVIAIENVRLFTELEGRNRDLTATSEILRVISSSPTDVQPVFDAIAENAVRLCDGLFGAVFRFDGELMHFVAHHHFSGEALDLVQHQYPRPPRGLNGSAILDRAVIHSADVLSDPRTANPDLARVLGYRSLLAVPILRESQAIGAIVVYGADAVPFPEEQIVLLTTFADQAVIAIENVRLFKELEARNRDLTEALDQQMATSEILRVISTSPTDAQPVFDTIIQNAVRLLGGFSGVVTRLVGSQLHLGALTSTNPSGDAAQKALWPKPVKEDRSLHGQVISALEPRFVIDVESDPSVPPEEVVVARARGYRSIVAVPLVRDARAVGSMAVTRRAPGPFSDSEIALLQTFAHQAVIAIENVRLFRELEARTGELTQSVEKLTALGEISQAVSSTLDVETVLQTIVSRASQLAGADGCAIYEYDGATEVFHIRATHNLDPGLVETLRSAPLRKGEGAMGRAAVTREPTQVADIAAPGAYQSHIRDTLLGAGYRALLSVPLLREGEIIGSLSLNRHTPGEFPSEAVEVLKTFATQSALAIQNARLFREIADKSAQLEAASRHKSEFLANMSHELRTPLNAIIGFSEVLSERMFGELNEKQAEYLKDIYTSGQHLLSLINDILDLSKIEAGRMELEATDFDLPSAIDNALTLVRERATRRGITLGRTIDERLGTLRGDERKVKQVLLNLLSNALKFTPEGGRIDVYARLQDGAAEIAVADTGVGIAPEDQEAVFEEFRQVGTADKKIEGTGLGLALSRKFIELHGGRIWVKSQVGHGSTFTFTLPVRREE
jgi:GAF domain-containing protein